MSKTVALLVVLFLSLGFVIYWTKKLFEGFRPLYKTKLTSIVDNKIKARTRFNKQYEVFEWEGDFEQYNVKFSSWLTYDNLMFSKNDYNLEIKYDKKGEYKNYSEYLPNTVRLNSKHFIQTSLKCDEKTGLIENGLKEFFEHGKPIDFDLYDKNETLEVLVFGYFSYKRFIDFLKKHFPDFLTECRKYSGEPTAKIMDIFKSPNLSVNELEVEIKKAVRNEDYEKAALLRDKIKSLKS